MCSYSTARITTLLTMYCVWEAKTKKRLSFAYQNGRPEQFIDKKINYLAIVVYDFRVIVPFKLTFSFKVIF